MNNDVTFEEHYEEDFIRDLQNHFARNEPTDPYYDLAIKFNNTGAGAMCPICHTGHRAEVGYVVTTRDTMNIVCDECSKKHAPNLYWALDVANGFDDPDE